MFENQNAHAKSRRQITKCITNFSSALNFPVPEVMPCDTLNAIKETRGMRLKVLNLWIHGWMDFVDHSNFLITLS